MIHIIDLTGIVLPADGAYRRDFVLPAAKRPNWYADRYDATTLVYDAARAPGGTGTVLSCPRLFNLWPILRGALSERMRERPMPWALSRRHHQFRTSEHLFLRHSDDLLSLEIDGQRHDLPIRPDLSGAFAGTNAMMCINKDNDPSWIVDWARFHARAHGMNALVLFDNGSSLYSCRDLAERLHAIEGVQQVAVFSAPFPYGPAVKRYRRQPSKFLQNALINMARLTLLARARAVLNVDIDELVLPKTPVSVFDAAVACRNRFVKIPGSWVFPDPDADWPRPQRDHLFRRAPNWAAHDKWCAVPAGLMSRFGWDMHKVADEAYRPLPHDRRFEMIHCRAATTGWKNARLTTAAPEVVRDEDIAALVRKYLPETA